MLQFFQVLTLILIAVAMATALAHALEFPGKLRLDRKTYVAVQAIYYPGFTLAGLFGEFGGILALLVLLFFTPAPMVWWTLASLACMLAMHGTYWLMTHPVNNFWLKETRLSAPAGRFFSLFSTGRGAGDSDWRHLRDIWEYSHVVRAVFAIMALLAMTIGLSR